jgi:Amidase
MPSPSFSEEFMDDTIATFSDIKLPEAPELTSLGVAAVAAAIRTGEITSESYVTALLQQARTLADLASFIIIDEAAVLTAARNADKAREAGSTAPLLGVPLGVKDSYLTKGLANEPRPRRSGPLRPLGGRGRRARHQKCGCSGVRQE